MIEPVSPGLLHQRLPGLHSSGRGQPTRRATPVEPDVTDERPPPGGDREEAGEV